MVGWCCLRHIYLYVRDINRLAPIRAVDRFMGPFVWLLVLPAGMCRPVSVHLSCWLSVMSRFGASLWGNPVWGFGINITFHVSLEMLGCTSCRACCLLWVSFFFLSFIHFTTNMSCYTSSQPQTATEVSGRRARCCISITVGTTAVNRPKYSESKSAEATLQQTRWTFNFRSFHSYTLSLWKSCSKLPTDRW